MPRGTERQAGQLLDRRALNRALLARQDLLTPSTRSPLEEIEHLVGMQAQVPLAPYVGLWTRLAAFDPAELGSALESRSVVRATLMRTTIHLVSAPDVLALRPTLQPMIERAFGSSAFAKRVAGIDLTAVRAAGTALVEERPRTVAEIGPLLAERFPGVDPVALAQAVRYVVPLVQVPPRGVWGRGGPAAFTTVAAWLGRPVDLAEPSSQEVEAIVLRYLASFGPASVADVQAWSWLTRLRPVLERLRPNLRLFRDENGVELFDLPDAHRPSAATPAPVRFVPEFDNLLVSHADRSRVTPRGFLERTYNRGAFLVDGFGRGAWRVIRAGGRATIEIEPFEPLTASDRSAVGEEAERVLAFAAAGAPGSVDIRTGGPLDARRAAV
jgi:Winged helix DNA-binding domain